MQSEIEAVQRASMVMSLTLADLKAELSVLETKTTAAATALDKREAAVKARENAATEREANHRILSDSIKERERKAEARETAQASLVKDLSIERATVKSLREREKFLEEKIKTLQAEKGTANDQLATARRRVAELEKQIATPAGA